MSNEQLLLQYLRSIEESVKRIETSMAETDSDHHDRISSLENSRANMQGYATGAGAIITALSGVVAWIVSLIKH